MGNVPMWDEKAGDERARNAVERSRPAESEPGTARVPVSEVFLEIPADRLYVVLARSAAVHIGAVLKLGVTDVTDLRLAVEGPCPTFLLHPAFPESPAAEHGLSCRFEAYEQELLVTV